MDVAAIRSDVAAALRAGGHGLNVYDVITPSPSLPAAHVGPPLSVNYHGQYSTERQIRLNVLLEVSRADHVAGQRKLDSLLSWPGVASTLEQYVSTEWSDLVVEAVGEARAVGDDSAPGLAVDLTVRITT